MRDLRAGDACGGVFRVRASSQKHVEQTGRGLAGHQGRQKRAPYGKLLQDFGNDFGAVCAVVLARPASRNFDGQQDCGIHCKTIEPDVLHGQQRARLIEFGVNDGVHVYAYGDILLLPRFESEIHRAVLDNRKPHCFIAVKILVGIVARKGDFHVGKRDGFFLSRVYDFRFLRG